MPVYNGMEFIEQALAALSKQTYANFVLLVSDNQSTDGTWNLLRARAVRDQRIVLHRQEQNIGAVANFRYVLDKAETEYFMWHAHDDYLAPNYLEELVNIITTDPECALACGTVRRVEPDGTPRRKTLPPFPDLPARSRLGRVTRLLRCAQGSWVYGLFRTEALRRAQATAEEFGYTWASDRLTLLPFILNDRIRGTDRTVFYSTRTETSSQTYRPNTLAEQIRFSRRYLRLHVRVFRDSELSLSEKLRCWPALLGHAFRTQGMLNYKHLVKRPVKRLVKNLAVG